VIFIGLNNFSISIKRLFSATCIFVLLTVFFLPITHSQAFGFQQPVVRDTIPMDTAQSRLEFLEKRRQLPSFLLWNNFNTNPLFPIQNPLSKRYSPFQLSPPTEQNVQIEMDTVMRYNISEQLDSALINPGYKYEFDEYSKMQELRIRQEYWRSRSRGQDGESAVSGRGLIPPMTVSPAFDRLFGGSEINIIPNGNVNLDFGGIYRRIDNPAIPVRQQRNGGFNFDQQIQMSVNGTLGQKMRIGANFDSNNSFDFQNQLKVEYVGFEEDIVKSVEIGNVSMPVQNSLIQGAQNLFGVKTQLQFGKLFMTLWPLLSGDVGMRSSSKGVIREGHLR